MTARIGFYHLQRSPLDQVLPRLLLKVLESGHRVLVMSDSPERVAYLDALLWTWDPDSWLPHGTKRDGDADLQPVYLTDHDENPNGADVLLLTDGAVSDHVEEFARCLTLFDGNDPEAVGRARGLWRNWKERGWDLTYYQQTDHGGWEEKRRVGEERC
jgi:DNA polymerase-3 subunit chi